VFPIPIHTQCKPLTHPAHPFKRLVTLTCFPVHSGRGLRMVGAGTTPSQSSRFMRMLNMRSASMKVSRLVMSLHPSSVSWGRGGREGGGGGEWRMSVSWHASGK
jgi:hypothetical protein